MENHIMQNNSIAAVQDNQTRLNTYNVTTPMDASNFSASNPNSYVEGSITDEEYFRSLPIGYRFNPTHDELIVHYVRKKINNQQLPRNRINVIDLYKFNPEELANKYKIPGDNELYFFTPREKKYKNGTRPNRSTPGGYWKASQADFAIEHNGVRVGSRKALVYYKGKPPRGNKTNWLMAEYTVINRPVPQSSSSNDMTLDDWVLCKIRLNTNNTKRRRRGDSANQDNSYDNTNEDQDAREQQNKHRALEGHVSNASNSAIGNHNVDPYYPNNDTAEDQGQYSVQEHEHIAGQGPYSIKDQGLYDVQENEGLIYGASYMATGDHKFEMVDPCYPNNNTIYNQGESFVMNNNMTQLGEDISQFLCDPDPMLSLFQDDVYQNVALAPNVTYCPYPTRQHMPDMIMRQNQELPSNPRQYRMVEGLACDSQLLGSAGGSALSGL